MLISTKLSNAETKNELIAVSKRFLDVSGDGECLCPLMDGPRRRSEVTR